MPDISGTLFAPGQRKGNKAYVWKGRLARRSVEVVCRDEDRRPTANARVAHRFVRRLIETARRRSVAAPAIPLTFAAAARAYAEGRGASKAQFRFVERLVRELGHMPIASVRQVHFDRAANNLYPHACAATKNRSVYAVGAAILHYGAENDWCRYRRVRKLKEPTPETRRPTADALPRLLAATTGVQRLFILTIFRQGWRISEALGWREDKIDLAAAKTELWISKAKTWKTLFLHADVVAALRSRSAFAELPAANGLGAARPRYVFPWRYRSEVYRWLRPLCRQLGIDFTPHMARHAFASGLRERAGATARDIRDAGTWTSERSTARYDHASAERVRALLGRLR